MKGGGYPSGPSGGNPDAVMCGSNRPRTTPYPGRGGDITELSCSAPRDIISTYDAASGDITRHTTLSLPIPGQKQGHHKKRLFHAGGGAGISLVELFYVWRHSGTVY